MSDEPPSDSERQARDDLRRPADLSRYLADEPPSISDRFGAVFPDGAVYDATEGACLFDQDPEQRARTVAVKIGGRPCRIRTTVEWLPDV